MRKKTFLLPPPIPPRPPMPEASEERDPVIEAALAQLTARHQPTESDREYAARMQAKERNERSATVEVTRTGTSRTPSSASRTRIQQPRPTKLPSAEVNVQRPTRTLPNNPPIVAQRQLALIEAPTRQRPQGMTPLDQPGAGDSSAKFRHLAPPAGSAKAWAQMRTMIYNAIGNPPTSEPPAYLRITKLPAPDKYDGTDDSDIIVVWLQQLLEYFVTLRMQGLDYNTDHLRVMASALSDRAGKWFFTNVQSPTRTVKRWYFEDAVLELHRRFVHKDPAMIAQQRYETTKYSLSRGGISELVDRLLTLKEQMVEPPSDYDFRTRFMNALPSVMANTMSTIHGMTPTWTPLQELIAKATELEAGSTWAQQYAEYNRARGVLRGSRDRLPPTGTNGPMSRPTTTHSKPSGQGYRTATGHMSRKDSKQRDPQGKTKPGHPGGGDRSTSKPRTAETKPNQASSSKDIRCYSCGQIGHYASEVDKCPKGHERRLFAQRVVNDTSDAELGEAQGRFAHEREDVEHIARDQEANVPAGDHPGELDQYPEDVGALELPQSDYEDAPDPLSSNEDKYYGSGYSSGEDPHVRLGAIRFGAMRVEPRVQLHDEAVHEMVRCLAMDVTPSPKSAKMAWLYDPRVRRINDPAGQPKRDPREQRTMTAEVIINGIKAYTLFDTGCTTDSISPEMAYVSVADRVDLLEQIGLQLGTRGAHTSINYGARPRLQVGPVDEVHYMDVVNIDRYDAILGTTFCNQHQVLLNFGDHTITIDGRVIPAHTPEEDALILSRRKDVRHERFRSHMRAARVVDPDAHPRA